MLFVCVCVCVCVTCYLFDVDDDSVAKLGSLGLIYVYNWFDVYSRMGFSCVGGLGFFVVVFLF